MIDNKRVNATRQRGIERIKQRPGDMEKGQDGKMNNKPETPANWKRNDQMSPCKA